MSDEWVAENLAATMSLNNVDELKAFVKSTMLYDNQASDVYTALHDKVSYADELPQTALDYYRDVLLYRIYTYAQNYGTDMATLLSSGMMGATYDSVDAYLDDATDSIKSIATGTADAGCGREDGLQVRHRHDERRLWPLLRHDRPEPVCFRIWRELHQDERPAERRDAKPHR